MKSEFKLRFLIVCAAKSLVFLCFICRMILALI